MVLISCVRMETMKIISILGYGELGKAIGSLLNENKIEFSRADVGEKFKTKPKLFLFVCQQIL